MTDAVWYAIPSASVDRCRQTLPAWREMGYRVAVLQNRQRGEIPADLVVWSDTYPGWAASVNLLCSQVVPLNAPIIVTGGDDMLPDPNKPAAEIAEEFLERFPHTFGVMQPTGDDFMNCAEYCGSPWLGRAWIQRAYRGNAPMWSGYRHNWADHELKVIADAYAALWQRPDLTQQHLHFSRTRADAPEYWRTQVHAHDRRDVERFIGRLLTAFPGHEPVGLPPIHDNHWRDAYQGPAFKYWATRYAAALLSGDAPDRLNAALIRCAQRGASRVVIYGVGTELRAAAEALREPPLDILTLADDAPEIIGSKLWGFRVSSLEVAASLSPDAVIICTRNTNEAMERRARAALGETTIIEQTGQRSPSEICHV